MIAMYTFMIPDTILNLERRSSVTIMPRGMEKRIVRKKMARVRSMPSPIAESMICQDILLPPKIRGMDLKSVHAPICYLLFILLRWK